MTDAYGSLCCVAIFSASLLLTLEPSHHLLLKTKGLNEDFSISITLWLYLSFFHVVGRPLLGTYQNENKTVRYCRMCDPYVKECFLTGIPQSCRRDIQPCIFSNVNLSFKIVFVDGLCWQKLHFASFHQGCRVAESEVFKWSWIPKNTKSPIKSFFTWYS